MRNRFSIYFSWLALAFAVPQTLSAQPFSESFRAAERGTPFFANAAAAEVATEATLAAIPADLATQGVNDLSFYGQPLQLPATNYYYQNYSFSNPKTGATNSAYIAFTGSDPNAVLDGLWSGMFGVKNYYNIYATAQGLNDPSGISAAQAQLNVSYTTLPIFQFFIFYNGRMEFSDSATFVATGRVHCNSNIFEGSPANLIFNTNVTCSGTISSPANAGYTTNTWTGTVTYNGSPGFVTNTPALNLLFGTNSTNLDMRQILYPPLPQESYMSALGRQRYWNKAHMTLVVSNNFFTATFKSAVNDPTPYVLTTNLSYLTNAIWNWISTTNIFFDSRENKIVNVTQIDIGKMTIFMANWLTTNNFTLGKFGNSNPFDIIYVADYRSTNGSTFGAIRLTNGATLTAPGLTVATPNPLYILGIYNCPISAFLNTTNTLHSAPASVVCDAITLLSHNWSDTYSFAHTMGEVAASDTVNTAIIAGNVPSTGVYATTYSGGVNNLIRLLENWQSSVLTLNTSLVCPFSSARATGNYVLPGTYYYAPELRQFSFDQNYSFAAKLPPGTPMVGPPAQRTFQAILSPSITPP